MAFEGFKSFVERLKRFINGGRIEEITAEVIEIEAADIVTQVRKQLQMGIDGNGNPVYLMRHGRKEYEYALSTIRKKEKIGAQIDPISNYHSGAFYGSIYVQVNPDDSFDILSSDWKYGLIKARSGNDILGLSLESQEFLFGQKIGPEIEIRVLNAFENEV
jgi:hypothetical protein